MAGLSPETLQEAGVTGIFLFENFNGNGAAQDLIPCLPDLTHTANRDTFGQGVAPAQRNIY